MDFVFSPCLSLCQWLMLAEYIKNKPRFQLIISFFVIRVVLPLDISIIAELLNINPKHTCPVFLIYCN